MEQLAHPHAVVVIKHWTIDRAWQMIFSEFTGAAHVDDRVKFIQPRQHGIKRKQGGVFHGMLCGGCQNKVTHLLVIKG